ncbi:MAG: HD domain-containing protein [Chitinophagales bacterium]
MVSTHDYMINNLRESYILQIAKEYVAKLFEKQLPSIYIYHDYTHTLDTINACSILGQHLKLSQSQQEILELAACLHDIGYIYSWQNHEEKSAELAQEFLKKMKYPKKAIKEVIHCILATKMPQQPTNLLESILCDADLVNLGSINYWERSQLLRKEWAITQRQIFSHRQWLEYGIAFLKSHRYKTKSGQILLATQKAQNLAQMQKMLAECSL